MISPLPRTVHSLLRTARFRGWALAAGSLLGLLGASGAAQAQSLNYTTAGATNVAGTFTDLGTTGTIIATANKDDANSAAQNIGFTFTYNGAAFTQFVLNTNGLIRLGSAAPSAPNMFAQYEGGTAVGVDPIGSTAAADVNLLMPFNADLQSGTATAVYRVATTGTAPNQVCTIQWKNVSDISDASPSQYANFTFQLKLYQTSNRIEFVYSTATASANTAIGRYPTVGIKGSGAASGQDVLANKTSSSAAWSTTVFITGEYGTSTHNYRSTVGPDAGRTYRFDPTASADASVLVYTLGQVSQAFASPHAVQALVTNLGAGALTSRTATLTVTGANPFSTTQTVPALAVGASAVITFAGYPLTNLGTNTVTVTLPADDVAGNNTSASQQVVSAGRLAYANPAATAVDGLGSSTANTMLYVKYRANSLAYVTTITPTFFVPTAGNTYQVQVYAATGAGGTPASTPLYTSATQTQTATAGAVSVAVPGVAVNGDFYVATKQLTATNIALAYQTEAPLRRGTFYYSTDGTSFSDLGDTFPSRLALETTLSAAPACGEVTGLTVGTVTNNTASLSFTAGNGATGYTISYTPAGGTTQTQTATASPVSLTGLTAGTAYTARVATNCAGGTTAATTPTASFTTTGVANDDCRTASLIRSNPSCMPTSGTTVGASQTLPAYSCGGRTGTADDDVWYRFTALSMSQTVTVTPSAGFDAVVEFLPSCNNAGSSMACANAGGAGVAETMTVANLTSGAEYFVRVYSFGSGAATQGAFNICITSVPTSACATVTNYGVSNVGDRTATLSFSTVPGATDYFFYVRPDNNGPSFSPAVAVGANSTSFTYSLALNSLLPGTTYTAIVQTGCTRNPFTSSVADVLVFTTTGLRPPLNDACASSERLLSNGDGTCAPVSGSTRNSIPDSSPLAAITCGGRTGTADDDVWYYFAAENTTQTVTVVPTGSFDAVLDVRSTSNCPAGPNMACADAGAAGATETVTLTGLTVGNLYTVRVYSYGSTAADAGDFTICLSSPQPTVPANDLCSAAFPMSCGTPLTGFTVGATSAGDPTSSCLDGTAQLTPGGRGVFYSIVGTGRSMRIATAGSDFDTELFVYTGSCGTLSCVASNDDVSTGNVTSQVTFPSVSGTTYYVMVAGFNNATGAVSLAASCAAAPLPVELAAFTAQAEGTGATLRWSTASEVRNDRFEVEASADGRSFALLATVPGQGSTTQAHAYTYHDVSLTHYQASLVYYRLRQVDRDGTATYSPVRSVALSGRPSGELVLVPNPAQTSATLTGATPGALVHVFDALGREVMAVTATAAGMATLVLPRGLASGVYVVRTGTQSLRLAVE